MKSKQFICIAISGLVLLSFILKGCCKQDSSDPYDIWPPWVGLDVSLTPDSSLALLGRLAKFKDYSVVDCGFWWSTDNNKPTMDDNVIHSFNNIISYNQGSYSFSDTLTGINPNTICYITAYAKYYIGKSLHTTGSQVIGFPALPVVITLPVIEFTKSTAIVGGCVEKEGTSSLTGRGVFYGISPDTEISGTKIEIATGSGSFSTKLTGLSPNTNYYIKAYASNSFGLGYGSERNFNTGNDTTFPKVLDIDGNVYHIVTIGSQIWMAENLRTARYNDGTAIIRVSDRTGWGLTSGAYCWYRNDSSTYNIPYGKLYNWYTVSSGKLCPSGWHVPSDTEWNTLETFLGGNKIAGGKLKEAGTIHWWTPNVGATNESGFSALPGGSCTLNGEFNSISGYGDWWSSTGYNGTTASFRNLAYHSGTLFSFTWGYDKRTGLSVRCVKD